MNSPISSSYSQIDYPTTSNISPVSSKSKMSNQNPSQISQNELNDKSRPSSSNSTTASSVVKPPYSYIGETFKKVIVY